MIENFLRRAERDEPVYLHEVRRALNAQGGVPLNLHVTLFSGQVRRYALTLPSRLSHGDADAVRRFVESYLHATLYNILVTLGATRIDLYTDLADPWIASATGRLNDMFQVSRDKRGRTGYGCCLNVNARILGALAAGQAPFRFHVFDLSREPAAEVSSRGGGPAPDGRAAFSRIAERAGQGLALGMDVGGTDIKLAVSVDGQLAALKEYDWFPAGFARAEQLIDPILTLTRLMRAAASLFAAGKGDLIDARALSREVALKEIEAAARRMEAAAGEALTGFDAIGLCFPDVVIHNKIVGGETYKTRGMRANVDLDYEAQFARITGLDALLRPFARAGGAVMLTNDGPMAAFTAAVEQAAADQDVSTGCFAHTLGTELGTGWVLGDGTIPDIPLEVYNCVIDLGSFAQRHYDADDVRSVNNFNTGLPGTLQKYACQSGVFRLAAKRLPQAAPDVYAEALARGLFEAWGDKLVVPTDGTDMRKPCLEFFMARAADSEPCAEIFRAVGEALGAAWIETQYLLAPETPARTLFGRLVKDSRCFELMNEGARRVAPGILQSVADESLANTALMRQLAAHPQYTVAQFAQAVGAVYYGYSGLI